MSDPFAFSVLAAQIPAGGKHFHIETTEVQRRAMAEALGIVGVEALTADVDVRPSGAESFAVRGALAATVVQTDVVTLEPLRQDVAEAIDLTLAPAREDSSPRKRAEEPSEAEAPDEPDVYRGGRIDLGAIVFEHLALGLDPYPKAPDAEFPGHVEDDAAAAPSPFAALAALKRERE